MATASQRLLARLSGFSLEAGGRPPAPQGYPVGPDSPFLFLSPYDALPPRDAYEHFNCLSETGGGKPSGPATAILSQYMRLGWGGLICTYKTDEVARVIALAKETGREDSLLIVTPGGPWKTNLLDFELTR